jgi:hypothetical protein
VKIAYSGGLGTYDILLADRVLFTGSAIRRLAGEKTGEMSGSPTDSSKGSPKEPAEPAEEVAE